MAFVLFFPCRPGFTGPCRSSNAFRCSPYCPLDPFSDAAFITAKPQHCFFGHLPNPCPSLYMPLVIFWESAICNLLNACIFAYYPCCQAAIVWACRLQESTRSILPIKTHSPHQQARKSAIQTHHHQTHTFPSIFWPVWPFPPLPIHLDLINLSGPRSSGVSWCRGLRPGSFTIPHTRRAMCQT